jgi:hypothetical protein
VAGCRDRCCAAPRRASDVDTRIFKPKAPLTHARSSGNLSVPVACACTRVCATSSLTLTLGAAHARRAAHSTARLVRVAVGGAGESARRTACQGDGIARAPRCCGTCVRGTEHARHLTHAVSQAAAGPSALTPLSGAVPPTAITVQSLINPRQLLVASHTSSSSVLTLPLIDYGDVFVTTFQRTNHEIEARGLLDGAAVVCAYVSGQVRVYVCVRATDCAR